MHISGTVAYLVQPIIGAVVLVLAVAGEIVSGPWSHLVDVGAVGCLLAWFIFQATPLMKSLTAAIDRNTRGSMLAVIAMRGVQKNIKDQAEGVIREIDHKK